MTDLKSYLESNSYPGRGILAGRTKDRLVMAYFIMGRSENSRNRVFVPEGDGIRTQAFDEKKLADPSLIIYRPVRVAGDYTIVTNGDQTDTIYDFLSRGKDFRRALRTREFEPDSPNYTPRISAMVHKSGAFAMSILKSDEGDRAQCLRYYYEYPNPKAGTARIIHTYKGDGNPIPSFEGEPVEVNIPDDIDTLTDVIWNSLNRDNKVSLFVRYLPFDGSQSQTRIINKNVLGEKMKELELKYGCNPNQEPAKIYMEEGELPVKVLNGRPGYINFLDALNGWQLVKELKEATGLLAATSFKHVSPAGAAVATPLSDVLKKIYFVEGMELTPMACAYARARGADRMSSFGDWISLSDECDAATAKLIAKEVSDGIIAPSYSDEALEILKKKKKGNYNIVQIDADYVPRRTEHKQVFGITFRQGRNRLKITQALLKNVVTANKDIPDHIKTDMIIAMITLKYTQSNSVCYVKDGHAIGIGAGQQSRIHCTRLAGNKADIWWLRQHPKVLGLEFVDGLGRADRDNAIDVYISDEHDDVLAEGVWQTRFKTKPEVFTKREQKEWLKKLDNVVLGSDAFFPFGDNIERAAKSGVKYVVQPGGSIRDDNVIETCDKFGMAMAFTGIRLFHH